MEHLHERHAPALAEGEPDDAFLRLYQAAYPRSAVNRFYAGVRAGGFDYGQEGNLFDLTGVPDDRIAVRVAAQGPVQCHERAHHGVPIRPSVRDRMTVRGLDRLNRFGVPGRAITVDLLVNLGLLFFLGSILAIVAAGNLGYVIAHVFALTALLLLRRDRPRWPRPVRLGRPLLVAVGALSVVLAFLCVVGATSFELTGYGGKLELAIALAILLGSVVLYALRRVVQDGERLRLRDEPHAEPGVPS